MPRLSAFFRQQPPLEHDLLGDGKNSLLEHRTDVVRQPVVQRGAAIRFLDKLDAKPKLGQRVTTLI